MNRRTPILAALALSLMLLCSGWPAGTGNAFAAENRGLAAPSNLLPAELRSVAVQDRFLPGGTREAGVIQTAVAHVIVARGDLSQAYYAASGDRLFEQDVVFTLADSKCRIKLLNEDIITLADNARLGLKEAAGSRGTAEKKSVLALARGKAMFYAIRLFNHRQAEMTVESPTAVTGVRGTKFGVEVRLDSAAARAARPLLLADASANWARHLILAQAGLPPPPQVTTVVHGFEGTVAVTSTVDGTTQTVGAGQTLSTTPQGMGDLIPTPPGVAQSFQAATNVQPPGAGGAQGSQGGAAPPPTSAVPTTTAPVADTANIIQQQTTSQTEQAIQKDPVADPGTNASGSHVGYFAGILSKFSSDSVTMEEAFVSRNRYNGDGNIWGRGLKNPGTDFLRVDGGGGFQNPVLKWAEFDEGKVSSGPLENAVTHQVLGVLQLQDGFMEWGWATIPSFPAGSDRFAVDNRAYWIFGPSPAAGLSLQGEYSGTVDGTFWNSAGGVNLGGSFFCDVNLSGGSGAVSNFNLSATGAGNVSASISGAGGSIGSDSHFSLGGGTWVLNNGQTAQTLINNGQAVTGQTRAVGSLYGSQATAIGGVWGMSTGSAGAVGVFHGTPVVGPTGP